MINIGFWNIGLSKKKKNYIDLVEPANESLSWLINSQDLDILAVCEFPEQNPDFLNSENVLDRQYEEAHSIIPRLDTRIFYSKQTVSCFSNTSVIDEERHCMNRFSASGLEFNLSCVHLPSKLNGLDDNTRKIVVRSILEEVKDIEKVFDNRTIVVGDFNADPYEGTMLGVDGFHALPDKGFAKTGRKVQGKVFEAFYNPTWNLYGDYNPPTGTHFYNNSHATNQLWYLLDQVIMRPDMIENFVPESLQIIYEGVKNKHGRPGKSDHFPIVFSLK